MTDLLSKAAYADLAATVELRTQAFINGAFVADVYPLQAICIPRLPVFCTLHLMRVRENAVPQYQRGVGRHFVFRSRGVGGYV